MNEYKKNLQDQYKWYMDKIENINKSNPWSCIPTNAFYFKLMNGSIKQKTDDIEWLEYALPKLEDTMAKIEAHIEREEFKKLTGVDKMSKLKKI